MQYYCLILINRLAVDMKFPIHIHRFSVDIHGFISIILKYYFPTIVKIYIILLPLFLGYDMSCVCRLSVRNACTVAKRYVVGGRR